MATASAFAEVRGRPIATVDTSASSPLMGP
jgi:hypothetical protein